MVKVAYLHLLHFAESGIAYIRGKKGEKTKSLSNIFSCQNWSRVGLDFLSILLSLLGKWRLINQSELDMLSFQDFEIANKDIRRIVYLLSRSKNL